MSLAELAKKFAECKKIDADLEAQKDKNNEVWDQVEKEMIELMINEGASSIRIDDLGLFSLQSKTYLSCNAADKPKMFNYLQESGNGGLLKLDVHAKTLSSFLSAHVTDIETKLVESGVDPIEAKTKAVDFLKEKGASIFKDQKIAMRKA